MRRNHLRELLKAGRPSLGTHLLSSWPSMVELIGRTGHFDYVEFVAEYAPFDLYALENLGRAIELFDDFSGMIKIEQEPRTHLATRAVGAGIQNVLFSDVRTVADVEECVRSVRAETPQTGGMQGFALRRDVGLVFEPGSPAYVQALEDVVVGLMIEKKEAVNDLPTLLALRGVDLVQFGPGDYAMSIGLPGQRDHPAVVEAEEYVIKTALQMGIAPRAECKPTEIGRYLGMGVRNFCIGTDVRILHEWWNVNGAQMRASLEAVAATQGG